MARFCATRAVKNAKFIQSVAPHVIPAHEPPAGFGSLVPVDILRRFHKMTEADLHGHPELVDANRRLRALRPAPPAVQASPRIAVFGGASFQGTLFFAKVPFEDKANGSRAVMSDADLAAAIRYATLAAPAISAYCSPYGANHINVSTTMLQHDSVEAANLSYNGETLENIVNDIVAQNRLPRDRSCVIVINPKGAVNTRAVSTNAQGYHDKADVPYCYVEPLAYPFTVDDRANFYASTLSHEVAEMVCDPEAALFDDEVCDGCDGNCIPNKSWLNLFLEPSPALANSYIGSVLQPVAPIPGHLRYTFYITGIASPDQSDDCPASAAGCGYPPPRPAADNELLFCDEAARLVEFYAVDRAGIATIQVQDSSFRPGLAIVLSGHFSDQSPGTTLLFYDAAAHTGEFHGTDGRGNLVRVGAPHTNWRSSWTQIVKGHFSTGAYDDLLFYDPSRGEGEFYSTGTGDITRIGATNSGWPRDWSIVVPGKFSNGPFTDLLFYSASRGIGEFWRTDGQGKISRIGVPNTDWLTTWLLIVPGKFAGGPFTDLVFYDRAAGIGELWRTDGEGNVSRIRTNTNWQKDWGTIIPGHFSGDASTELFFYAPVTGLGEFRRLDRHGIDTLMRDHHGFRKNCTTVVNVF